MIISLNGGARRASPLRTSAKNASHGPSWECCRPLKMVCINHPGETAGFRCGRWQTCPGCSLFKSWQLRQRFLAGILDTIPPYGPRFFTLTFRAERTPDEDEAHACLRSLVARLRYRRQLSHYGWVLQRTRRGTLHYHGIAQMTWYDDDLVEWRELIQRSGFDIQNRLEVARAEHASYCARYIATRLARLQRHRGAYGFSRGFPKPDPRWQPDPALLASIGIEQDPCLWLPGSVLA